MARQLAVFALIFLYAFILAKAAAPAGPNASPSGNSSADKVGALDAIVGNDTDDDVAAGPVGDKPDSFVAPTSNDPLDAPPSGGKRADTTSAKSGGSEAVYNTKSSAVVAAAGVVATAVFTGFLL